MHFRSHRGGVYYTPENTMPAFRDALAQGFDVIETDPTLTKDGVIVLSHDATVNRCLRHPDGSLIEEQQRIRDLTYEELMAYDAGLIKGEAFRGTKVPTLEELFSAADGTDTVICIDKYVKWYDGEKLDALFALVNRYNVKVSYLVETFEQIEKVQSRDPDALIDWDGLSDEETLKAVCAKVKYENLVVWLYMDKPNFAWLKEPLRKTSKENCARVKQYARLGISNVSNPSDVKEAFDFEPYIIEV